MKKILAKMSGRSQNPLAILKNLQGLDKLVREDNLQKPRADLWYTSRSIQ